MKLSDVAFGCLLVSLLMFCVGLYLVAGIGWMLLVAGFLLTVFFGLATGIVAKDDEKSGEQR